MAAPSTGPAEISSQFRHPIDAARRGPIVDRYRQLFPKAVDDEIAVARRLNAHHFMLLGQTMDHGERIAWSRDPVSGEEWSREFSADIPYRGPERLGDIKLPWELNKHQYFFTLGKASWLTGDATFAREIIRQIDEWLVDNPYLTGVNWISALEAGTRVLSWVLAYPFFSEHADPAFRARLARSLALHLRFVEEHLSIARFNNTHLVGEAAILVTGGLFLQTRNSDRWISRGLGILTREIDAQVTSDGVHAERSIAYHRFFLDHYYLVEALLAANGRTLGRPTLDRVEQMTTFLMQALLADGTAPAFGDGDDARALWLRADCTADYRSLLALGAGLFARSDFASAAGGATEEAFWLLGDDGVARVNGLVSTCAGQPSAAYLNGGYVFMRSGDRMLSFDSGALGYGPAGHGHADALSLQLHAGGYPFLVDAGTYSYNLDYGWRAAFRGTRAHNTVLVDGFDQSQQQGRMSWSTMASARVNSWTTTEWFDAVDGEHDGYQRLRDPVTHRRVVLFVKPDVWIVWDVLAASGRHAAECLWHLSPDCRVDITRSHDRAWLISPRGERLELTAVGAPIQVVTGTDEERGAWYSPSYGRKVPSTMLRLSRQIDGATTFATSLSFATNARVEITEAPRGISVRITRGDGHEQRLSYSVNAADTVAEGIRFHGKLLFTERHRARPARVHAQHFKRLTLDHTLDVNSPTVIDTLVLDGDRCRITLGSAKADEVRVQVPTEISVELNG